MIERSVIALHFHHPVKLKFKLFQVGGQFMSGGIFVGRHITSAESFISFISVEQLCHCHGAGSHIPSVISGIVPASGYVSLFAGGVNGSHPCVTGFVTVNSRSFLGESAATALKIKEGHGLLEDIGIGVG